MAAPIYKGGRPFFKPGIRFANNIVQLTGTTAPVDGTSGTGVGVAGPGSLYLRTNGTSYTNVGTKASPVWQATGGVSVVDANTKFCTTQFDAVTGTTGTTLTNVVGLTGFSLEAGASYAYEINISGVSTVNCGMKIGLGYTTLTATSIEISAQGYTAAAVAVQHSTTSTSGMTMFGQTAAVIAVRIFGRLVVNAAGTVAVQAAQNAAHADTTSVFVGSWATFSKVS
jgi:hypothetical protein